MSVDAATGQMLAPRTNLPSVQEALCSAAAAVGAIPKSDTNPEQGFKYRGIERILAGVGPALHRAGVVVFPRVLDVHREEMLRGAKQTVWRLVTLTVAYDFVGPAGDTLTAVVMGEGLDPGDKAVTKAFTMAYKVALLQTLQIADADTDPDGESPPPEQHRQQPNGAAPRPPKPKPSPAAMEAKVAAEHGPDHVRLIGALVKSMDTLEPGKRKECKAEFVERWGNPWELTPDRLGEARNWLLTVLSPAPALIEGGAP